MVAVAVNVEVIVVELLGDMTEVEFQDGVVAVVVVDLVGDVGDVVVVLLGNPVTDVVTVAVDVKLREVDVVVVSLQLLVIPGVKLFCGQGEARASNGRRETRRIGRCIMQDSKCQNERLAAGDGVDQATSTKRKK